MKGQAQNGEDRKPYHARERKRRGVDDLIKRSLGWMLILVLIFCLALTGCSSDKKTEEKGQSNEQQSQTKTQETTSYMLGTASTGGYTYQWGTSLAQLINKYSTKVHLTAQVTAGSGENIERLASKNMEIGVVSNDWILKYYKGDGVNAFKDVRIIYVSPGSVMSLVVPKASKINTIYDLKGKKVDVGPQGGGTYEANMNIFDALGIKTTDFKAFNMSTNEGCDALKAGQIDARITQSVSSSWIEELATGKTGLKLISLADEDIKKVIDKYPTYEKIILPPNSYTGVDYPVQGPGRRYSLVVGAGFPEEHAYEIAKILNEHYDEWIKNLPTAKDSTLEATIASAETVAPLHDGTTKLAKEKGLIK